MNTTARRQKLRSIFKGTRCIHPGSVFDPISARVAEDLGYLSECGVRVSLQGHQPFMAAVQAMHDTLKKHCATALRQRNSRASHRLNL